MGRVGACAGSSGGRRVRDEEAAADAEEVELELEAAAVEGRGGRGVVGGGRGAVV